MGVVDDPVAAEFRLASTTAAIPAGRITVITGLTGVYDPVSTNRLFALTQRDLVIRGIAVRTLAAIGHSGFAIFIADHDAVPATCRLAIAVATVAINGIPVIADLAGPELYNVVAANDRAIVRAIEGIFPLIGVADVVIIAETAVIADAIPDAVMLLDIVDVGAVVAGVSDAVTVRIRLVGIGDFGAVVAASVNIAVATVINTKMIDNAVLITIGTIGVSDG